MQAWRDRDHVSVGKGSERACTVRLALSNRFRAGPNGACPHVSPASGPVPCSPNVVRLLIPNPSALPRNISPNHGPGQTSPHRPSPTPSPPPPPPPPTSSSS